MKFNQVKTWLMIAGLLFFAFPQTGQAGWFDNDAENAIAYYEGYNRAMAQYAVPYKTTTNTVTDTSVSELESEINDLQAQINSLNSQIDNLVIDSGDDSGNFVSASTWVTNPMKQDLDAAGYDIFDVGSFYGNEVNVGDSGVLFPTNNSWGGMVLSSGLDVGVIFDNDNNEPISAFRVLTDSDDMDTATELFRISSGGDVGVGDFRVDPPREKIHVSTPDGSPRVLLEGYSPASLYSNTLASTNNKNWAWMASGDNFYGDVVGDDFNGGYHWLEVVRDEFDVDAINFPMGDINISDSLHVGTTDEPFSNGLITSYTESNTYPAFRGVAVGDHTQAGWFAANGEAASGIFASAEGLDAYAGYFDGNVKIQSDSTNDSLYVISDGTGMAGRFESYDSDAVYGVAMDDYNNAGHFRHMGEYGSALHAVAYASSSRAGLFEGNVKISGDLEVTTTWHDPALSLSSYGDGNALSTYYGDVDINNGNLIVSGWEASRVGIGTETPNKQLHIYSDNENAEINIQSGQNTHWGIYQDEWSGDMLFWNEQNRVIFTDYGYVGIGTTTPEYMLDVGGDVRAFEFCLDYTCINTWEDLADILGIAPSAAN